MLREIQYEGSRRRPRAHSLGRTDESRRKCLGAVDAGVPPFLACTIQATPSAPARDLSSSATTALTSLTGLAAVPVASEVSRAEIRSVLPEKTTGPDLQRLQKTFREDLKDWKYTFANNSEVRDTLDKLGRELNDLLQQEGSLEAQVGEGPLSAADLADLRKFRDSIAQRLDVINAALDPKNSGKRLDIIELPMDRFRQKTVSETITLQGRGDTSAALPHHDLYGLL